jgi:Cof subfamily protein (haloacid dehalogenase superfamily)
MGIFDKYLLICDMDGTLVNSKSEIGEKSIEAIKYFIANGGSFSFATGRNPKTMKKYHNMIGVNAVAILYNGGMLYDFNTDNIIKQLNIDNSVIDVLYKISEKFKDVAIEIHKDSEIFQFNGNTYSDQHLKAVDSPINKLENLSDVPFPWNKVGFWFRKEVYDDLKEFTISIPNDKIRFIRSHEYSGEFLSADCDKGIMLDELRSLYPDKCIVACGDNENDILMLKKCDIAFAPKNAFKCAKDVVTFVTELDCDNDFIIDVIETLESL